VRALRVWSLPRHAGLVAIRGYQRWISPQLRTCCRYEPSCSRYGADAVRVYGLLLGSRLALGRIRRCTRDVAHRTPDPLLLPHPAAP
jgi:putative membrane protein insertion efficiency factor